MSRIFTYRCDGPGCGARAEWPEGGPAAEGWWGSRWVPGFISNVGRKPDRHFCSVFCLDEYQKTVGDP